MAETAKKDQKAVVAKTPLSPGGVRDVPVFLQQYGWAILAGIALVALVAMAAYIFKTSRDRMASEAGAKLAAIRTLPELEKFIADYSETPLAPSAMLLLANAYYNAADYDMALNKYLEFKQKFPPTHILIPAAEMGRLHCLEARQQFQEALDGFTTFQKTYPTNFLCSQAVFGQGRCLEQFGLLNEARTVYEDFIARDPKNLWVNRAKESLESVNKKLQKPVNAPANSASNVKPPAANKATTGEGPTPASLPFRSPVPVMPEKQ